MPGQTPTSAAPTCCASTAFNGGPGTCPANPPPVEAVRRCEECLQWRAGHVPGQTGTPTLDNLAVIVLQWRAGHVPGQTARLFWWV